MGSPVLMKKPLSGMNIYDNPEAEPHILSAARNSGWSKPNYQPTQLSQEDELKFQNWAKFNPSAVRGEMTPDADYDIRGYWSALNNPADPNHTIAKQAPNGHYPDVWKTPYSGVFSRESKYATPSAPKWVGDTLVTSQGSRITGPELSTMKRTLK